MQRQVAKRQQVATQRSSGTSIFRRAIDKLISYLSLVKWILKVAQRPTPDQLKTTAKVTLIMVLVVGMYAFIMSLIRYIVFMRGTLVTLPPPYNYILIGVIAGSCVGILLFVYLSLRRTVKSRERR
ncbi:MAG: hypothetical protein GXO23_07395 [Crenarchaeota archaeon]|nr:hypothetical protein [Thermoproteota archaeon]